ncbi:MAG: hypothetical protein NC432_03780 [Roseburia sp.]|nr:hypothetical protein [Roseburia sp.]MCM1098465.1 hypothetical protein [Ruminococcus flavefaciens]
MNYLTFPWEQLGNMLRRLSLSGGAGNLAAWVFYLAAGLSPLALLAWLLLQKRNRKADWLLLLIAVLLLTGLWFFINPTYLEKKLFPVGLGEAGKCAFALTIDSALLTWFLLRFLSGYEGWERRRLFREARVVLLVYTFLSAAGLFLKGAGEFTEKYDTVKAGNTMASQGGLELSYAFLLLQIFCTLLPEALELALWSVVLGLLRDGGTDGFSEKSRRRVELIKRLSARFLAAVLFANLGMNLLQLLFGRKLYSSSFTLTFPLRETVILLGILILSGLYLEGSRLKEDNDLFI